MKCRPCCLLLRRDRLCRARGGAGAAIDACGGVYFADFAVDFDRFDRAGGDAGFAANAFGFIYFVCHFLFSFWFFIS